MSSGIWPVEADGHARYATPLERLDRLGSQQRRRTRCDIRAQAEPYTELRKFIKVRAFERIAARKHHQRIAEVLDLLEQIKAFLSRKLVWIAPRHGAGAAVHARQIAGLRYLPDDQHRRFVEIHHVSLAWGKVANEGPRGRESGSQGVEESGSGL